VDPPDAGTAIGRARGDNPITGFAAPRSGSGRDYVSFPFYGPWGQWYPWYAPGFGWYAGYIGYNPWGYAATCWSWGIYGPWYDPYNYCWGAYYWPTPMYYGVEIHGAGGSSKPRQTTGEIRLLATPKEAKVYIDGALVGTVDEFNGLNSHLEIDGGRHMLRLQAEGFETYSAEIFVETGRTQTVRITMKKAK
jgi:hypothetical protein